MFSTYEECGIAHACVGDVPLLYHRRTLRESISARGADARGWVDDDGLTNQRRPAAGATGIFELSDQYIVESAALDPVLASFWGIPGHDDEMTDYSPDGWDARLELQRQTIRSLGQLQPQDRRHTHRDRGHARTCASRARPDRVRRIPPMPQRVEQPPRLRPRHLRLHARGNRIRIGAMSACRLADGSYRARQATARASSTPQRTTRSLARRQAIACGEQCRGVGRPRRILRRVGQRVSIADLSAEAAGAAGAFIEFGEWLSNDYAAMATPHDPVGAERYRLFARFHNGTDLDLDETYQWGWDELRSIEARIAALVERILPGASRDECIEQVKNDPRYSVEGADNFLAWSQEVIDRTIDDLDGDYFDIAEPLRNCRAMAAPAGGPETAYYTPPSEDFSRPGQIWHQVAGKEHFPAVGGTVDPVPRERPWPSPATRAR